MPLYNCQCKECAKVFEVLVPLDELDKFDKQRRKKDRCPACGGRLKRHMPGPMFKIN